MWGVLVRYFVECPSIKLVEVCKSPYSGCKLSCILPTSSTFSFFSVFWFNLYRELISSQYLPKCTQWGRQSRYINNPIQTASQFSFQSMHAPSFTGTRHPQFLGLSGVLQCWVLDLPFCWAEVLAKSVMICSSAF